MTRAALLPLGAAPYDGFLLPIVSPDGRFVATQTGSPPDWETTLAEPAAQPPVDTVVQIYRLDTREAIKPDERLPPERVADVQASVVLGRSCDIEGFLVEAPQSDGSRWIGKASWQNGEIRWLVQNDAVNAFAALAPDGRLAWCRRAEGAQHFDLWVRDITLEEWSVPGAAGDWLMPVWSTFGDGLYALHRANSRLRVCFGSAKGSAAFQASQREFVLFANSDRYAAYQTVIAQGALDGSATSGQPLALLFHPRLSRMMMWWPLATDDRTAVQLNAGSIAALQENPDAVIVCKRDELILQSLRQADASILLSEGTWVPRRTPRWDWRYVLLSPDPESRRVQITAMRLLPLEEAVAPAR